MEPTFKDQFFSAIQESMVPLEESSNEFQEGDMRWAETKRGDDSPTGKPQIYINQKAFEKNPQTGPNYVQEMLIGEGLHLIKDIDPERADRLYETAINDKETLGWLKESYKYSKDRGEKRPFKDWVKNSRLDQIVGGYLLGGPQSSVPTMQSWPTERLPYGQNFKAELDKLKKDLGL